MFNLIEKAYAAGPTDKSWFENLIKPIKAGSGVELLDIVATVVNAVLLFAGIIAVVYLIYGGILYMTAGGDAEKATKGRTAIVNAVIGVVIILLAFLIMRYVTSTIT